jgi:sterol desaturase/sphingolipid hydroxylase (fatty acid hydroxylase superfamily)
MELQDAIRFSKARIATELFSAGSILSVYSLATSFLVGFLALAYLRRKRRGRPGFRAIARAIYAKRNILTHESFVADVKLFVLSTIFMPVIVAALVVSTATVSNGVHMLLQGAFGPIEPGTGHDGAIRLISTVVLFLAYEIGYWVDHWLKHRVPLLWSFHRLHHTAEVLTPLTNFRNHPIDSIVFGYMLAMFIGGASGLLAWLFDGNVHSYSVDGKNILFIVFLWTIGHLQHSQLWIPFSGRWGRLVLSPAHHQIHHSNDPRHYNRNFGSVLAIWDGFFGTLEIPSPENPRLAYGAAGPDEDPHSTTGILVAPVIDGAREIARLLTGAVHALTNICLSTANRLGGRRHG